MYENQEEPTVTRYRLEEVAEEHEAEHFQLDEDYDTFSLASSLFTASEMVGHNNPELREAVGYAQQIVGNTENIADNLKPFEVNEVAYAEANLYLQKLKDISKVSLAQSKMIKSDEAIKYRDIDRLINGVGLAESYKNMKF